MLCKQILKKMVCYILAPKQMLWFASPKPMLLPGSVLVNDHLTLRWLVLDLFNAFWICSCGYLISVQCCRQLGLLAICSFSNAPGCLDVWVPL
jgi:hypothetical protein